VKLDDLKKIIDKYLPEAEETFAVEDLDAGINDAAMVIDLLEPYLRKLGLPTPIDIFQLGEDDEPEGLERDVWYAVFEESNLFVRTPTPGFNKMKKLGVAPVFHNWSMWG